MGINPSVWWKVWVSLSSEGHLVKEPLLGTLTIPSLSITEAFYLHSWPLVTPCGQAIAQRLILKYLLGRTVLQPPSSTYLSLLQMALLSVTLSQFCPPRSFCPGGVLRVVLPLPGSPDPFRETGREQSKVVQMNNSSNIIYYATLLCPRYCSQHLARIHSVQHRARAVCVRKTSSTRPALSCLLSF